MRPDDGTDITTKISSTSCGCQVLCGVQSVGIDHEVPHGKVSDIH
jgi:hypothetical protein